MRVSRRGLHAANNGPRLINSAVLACMLLARIEWAERGAYGAQLCAPQAAAAHGGLTPLDRIQAGSELRNLDDTARRLVIQILA